MDIVVTTPKYEMKTAADEAAYALERGGFYFRSFKSMPKVQAGDRVYYVDDGWIRGFAIAALVEENVTQICEVTGRVWNGCTVHMRVDSWTWIYPISCTGFQGFRYASGCVPAGVRIVGNWKDPRPRFWQVENNGRRSSPSGEWCFYDSKEECDDHQGCGFHT